MRAVGQPLPSLTPGGPGGYGGYGSGMPQRGFTASGGMSSVGGGGSTAPNDLSALVNANLALAQQNLAMAGSHTNPDSGYIRLGLSGGGGGGSSLGGGDLNHGEIPRIHGSKRERAPSNPFLGTSFGVAGSFGSVFGHDYLSSTPESGGLFPGSFGTGLSPPDGGGRSTGGAAKMAEMVGGRNNTSGNMFGSMKDDLHVGSLGGMGALDDSLPLVGSLELGSPLDTFGDLMASLPKGSHGSKGGKLPMRTERRSAASGSSGPFGRQGGGGGAAEAASARVTRAGGGGGS